MDLNAALVFVKVIQAGSFSQAAKQLDMPISTVSAKVAALEKRLGVSLLKRTTRKLHLTDSGVAYFEHAVKAVSELQQAEVATALGQEEVQGKVKITAPVEMGMSTLTEVLAEFLKKHPKIKVELLLTDRLVDLIGEGVDLAIRMGQLKDSSLISKKIGTAGFQLYAAPAYLKKAAPLKRPQDLEAHHCLIFSILTTDYWFLRRGETVQKIKVQGPFAANNLIAIHRMAVEGYGVALLPSFLCQEDVEKNRLVHVLDSWSTDKNPVHLVYPQQKYLPKSTRAILDFLSVNLQSIF
ncbi:MAG: LysR substrate-binding domain-containing protein [Bdellovibrionales bacterium]